MLSRGKTALVTGGGTGIGAAICIELARRGVNIAINHLGDGNIEEARDTAATCNELGVRAAVIQGDVSLDDDCRRMIDQAAAHGGGLDYLVNNAGWTKGRPLTDLDAVEIVEFEKAFAVNTVGPFLLARYAAPHMRHVKGAAIVNIASMAGLIGFGSSHGYCASKAALINLTRSLARVLGPDIRVNCICPGLVETRHSRTALGDRWPEIEKLAAKQNPLGSVLQPEEIAMPTVFLLMDALQITGEIVRVDGGGHLGEF